MNRVRAGFLSLSRSLGPDADRSYLEWHQLDHMPEQYQLLGLHHGQRWLSSRACLTSRPIALGAWAEVEHMVLYLMGDPVERTLDDFMQLGSDLRDAGRYPVALPSVFAGAGALVSAAAAPAALVTPEVVPWRPNRGVVLVVAEAGGGGGDGAPVLSVDGVAGVWRFETSSRHRRWRMGSDEGDYEWTVVYLDTDPARAAGDVCEAVLTGRSGGAAGILLAAPFEALTPWVWQPVSAALRLDGR